MPSSPGRSTDPRAVASVVTTSASAAITAPSGSFNKSDAGRPITGAGITAGTTLLSVTSSTAATLSINATASATVTLTLGTNGLTPYGYGFNGWSPETDAESQVYSIANGAGATAPSVLTDAVTRVAQRNR